MKKLLMLFLYIASISLSAQNLSSEKLTDQEILELIQKHRPSNGGVIPADLKNRLGATHMDGQYYLTDEPFIVEGAKKLSELGYGVLKLWFAKADGNVKGYKYNSDWGLTRSMTFKELARHPYYKEVFNMPFKVFALNINEGYAGASAEDQTEKLNRIEDEFYDLTIYLLTEYKDRDISFILEMWEGDWVLRGGLGPQSNWKQNGAPDDVQIRVNNMIDWLMARQKGVERARNEITESKCKVYNAVEVNRVFEGLEGIPSITTDVLPKIRIDMVSWSCYEGQKKNSKTSDGGLLMYKGLDIIRQFLVPSEYMKGKNVVFIGEVGKPENVNNQTRESIQTFWDEMMGVYFAQNIPFIIHWELYCNESIDHSPKLQNRNKTRDEMRGYWLIRPDGTKSWAQEYFEEILSRANSYN